MRAIQVINPGPASELAIVEMETPAPAAGEVLVRVHATALNRADLMQRAGTYPPPPGGSEVLGLEMAGVVDSWGASCSGWEQGDRVFGLLAGGGYAEYVTIPETLLMRVPQALSFEEAAAIPEAFLTAYQALYWLGELMPGDAVLIHAGASGVGTAAIQMAIQTGATVYVTASAAKHATCLALGAAAAIDYKSQDFAAEIDRLTEGMGVALIVDFIGAPYFEQNITSLRQDGRLVLLAMMGGNRLESVDLRTLFRKRIQIKPSTLRSRSVNYKAALTKDFAQAFLSLINAGDVRSVIDSIYAWDAAGEAHARMTANKNAGKIVLRVDTV